MVFSSLIFLFLFLPLVLLVYYAAPRLYRNALLLTFSYFFYLWGGGKFVVILILSTFIDYVFGMLIDRNIYGQRKLWVIASISLSLSLLAYFKYSNFFVAEFSKAISSVGLSPISWANVILPIGISFFTFHKISYIIDVYRGTSRPLTNFIDFALYVSFFPQLIAGPIIRFHEISRQFQERIENREIFYRGFQRFSWGLIKKVCLANPCGEIANGVFALDPGTLDTKTVWLGVFAYTLQIYFDFSGYSDMAIGLAQLFGFKFPENFNRPYSSLSITDFWRRWHMSLSRFFRDYLYIPLGGNRQGAVRTYFNLGIVFTLCGLWHGANWTFLVWGMFHGGLLMTERLLGIRDMQAQNYIFLRRLTTFVLIMIGWVFFRASNVGQAVGFLKLMVVPTNTPIPLELLGCINNRNLFFMFIASLVVFLPRDFYMVDLITSEKYQLVKTALAGFLVILTIYSVASITGDSYNPFIYFQF